MNNNTKASGIEILIIKILKHKKSIFLNVLIITVAAIIVSFIIPKKYTATASFISPKKKGGIFGEIGSFSSSISNLSRMLGGRLGNVTEEAYNYLVLLQSRTASERVINEFDLRKVYKFDPDDPIEEVIEELQDNVKFNIEDEGNIVISVTDKIPKRAADIANFYVDIVNEMSIELSTREAKNNREFIEKRFFEIKKEIFSLEDSLKTFGKKYNVLEIKEQVKGSIEVAANLKAQIEISKIETDLLRNYLGEDHPVVLQAKLKFEELNKRLNEMQFGEEEKIKSIANFFIPFEKVPETGVKYIRLMRDYEIQTKLLEFIYPIYEQARIDEQKTIPVVVVVDQAIPPQKKSSPKRVLIVLGSFFVSLILSVGYALLKESYIELQKDENRYKAVKEGIFDQLKIFSRKDH